MMGIARPWGRTTIAGLMALVAVTAVMLASTIGEDSLNNDLLNLSLLFILPAYFLIHLGRRKSIAEIGAAALAMAYLAWGASIPLGPVPPSEGWDILRTIHQGYWGVGYQQGRRPTPFAQISPETLRWNWGLLAAFYAAVLVVAITRRARGRPMRAGPGRSSPSQAGRVSPWLARIPPAAELMLALWFLCVWHHGSFAAHMWSPGSGPLGGPGRSWLCLAGLGGSLTLAVVDWRPRPPNWRPLRDAARLARLVPAMVTGAFTGLVWSLDTSRTSAVAAALLLVIMLALSSRKSARRVRRRTLILILAMFWGFAIFSAEIIMLKIPAAVAR